MSKVPTKTDHSYFAEKVQLRLNNLPDKEPINVLDMFAGQGMIWDEVIKRSGRKINILGMEKKAGIPRIYLLGDNEKYQINYDAFDLIDLDAYSIPYRQMKRILDMATKKIGIFVTLIQVINGRLPSILLLNFGYTKVMIRKSPTIFNRHGQEKLLSYLAMRDIRWVKFYSTPNRRKTYLYFETLEKAT